MAYEDFSMKHYKQLIEEKQKWNNERKELRNELNKKDDEIMEKDNLLYSKNIRLANYDETASKVQENGGRIVGLLNRFNNQTN